MPNYRVRVFAIVSIEMEHIIAAGFESAVDEAIEELDELGMERFLRRLPLQESQWTQVEGRKSISSFTRPLPLHSGQRPPSVLKEKREASKPRARASGNWAKTLRISSKMPT